MASSPEWWHKELIDESRSAFANCCVEVVTAVTAYVYLRKWRLIGAHCGVLFLRVGKRWARGGWGRLLGRACLGAVVDGLTQVPPLVGARFPGMWAALDDVGLGRLQPRSRLMMVRFEQGEAKFWMSPQATEVRNSGFVSSFELLFPEFGLG